MLPYIGIEIYFRPTAEAREIWQATMIHIAQEGGCFVLSSNQFCRKGRLSTVNRNVCQYNKKYCTWCYFIIIQLWPFWLNLISKGVSHLKQSFPLLMFQNLEGVWAKLDFSGNRHQVGPNSVNLTPNIPNPISFTTSGKAEVLDELQLWLSCVKIY